MNHISYQLATDPKDELLQQGAAWRYANQVSTAAETASSGPGRGGPVKVWLGRAAASGSARRPHRNVSTHSPQ
jgi:hypothetical protein